MFCVRKHFVEISRVDFLTDRIHLHCSRSVPCIISRFYISTSRCVYFPRGNISLENLSYSLALVKTDKNDTFYHSLLGGKCVTAAVANNEIKIFYADIKLYCKYYFGRRLLT